MWYTISNTMVYNIVFMFCLFLMRKVSSQFKSNYELVFCAVILSLTFSIQDGCLLFLGRSKFVVLGYYLYFMIFASIACVFLTALLPILETFTTSSIIPFSLNQECLNSFESAIIQETSSTYFYEYLVNDIKTKRGITLFALYVDLRRFMILCDEKNRLEKQRDQDIIFNANKEL